MRLQLGLVFVTYNKTLRNLFVIRRPEEQECVIKKLSLFKTIFQKIIFVVTLYFLNQEVLTHGIGRLVRALKMRMTRAVARVA